MPYVLRLSTLMLVLVTLAAADVTIGGLAYYIDVAAGENGNAPAFPIYNGSVTLYKRTVEGTWEEVDSTATTETGYYHFDDVSTVGTLWFKVHVDAEGCIEDWEEGYERDRVVYKEVRPSGIPDPGII